jgi:hypothetical protein
MSAKDVSVCNTDLLQSAKFIFSLPRITSTQFFCQTANIPGISTQNSIQATPFSDLNIPGDKLVYETLNIGFLVDEELESWTQIHDWMRGIAFPESFDERQNLKLQTRFSEKSQYPQYSDAELITLAANNTPKTKFHFIDLFPIQVSGIPFDIRIGSEQTITATAIFKFKRYDITRI